MNKIFYLLSLSLCLFTFRAEAGNPDRQGEAGAYELLMNPWARSAGLHTMTTSMIMGVESMRLNPAGLSRISGGTEVLIGHARYLEPSDVKMNAFGVGQRMGKNGTFGLSIMSLDMGEIEVTTPDQPEGTGATFSPNFFHLGLSYAHLFENKISVGITFRAISESISDVSAFGFALDAGVQYVTGPKDNFKFGISLRNVGSRMTFGGQGLSFPTENPDGTLSYDITVDQRSAGFELPSVLNIGMSYDFNLDADNRFTLVGNFTANSFSRDQIGGGVEYALKEMFMIRAGYKFEMGLSADRSFEQSVYTGLSGGVTIDVPTKKGGDSRFGIDYAFRATSPFNGTHNLGVRIVL
ncbi:MAG: PorV/PorQ family protein [Bacteroidota bacterium]